MPRLTTAERRILKNPPTETTWVCQAKRVTDDGVKLCNTTVAGRDEQCWLCRKPRPRRPKLLWPVYLAACKKAKHEAGTPFREGTPTPPSPPTRVRRKKGS